MNKLDIPDYIKQFIISFEDKKLLSLLGYTNNYQTTFREKDPKPLFLKQNINNFKRFYKNKDIIIPTGTLLFHGFWTDLEPVLPTPNQETNRLFFGLYPLISLAILTETLKKYNFKTSYNAKPYILVFRTKKEINTFCPKKSLDVFLEFSKLDLKTTPYETHVKINLEILDTFDGLLSTTGTPFYNKTDDCAKCDVDRISAYELSLRNPSDYLEQLAWFEPNLDYLTKGCTNCDNRFMLSLINPINKEYLIPLNNWNK